MTRKVLGVVAAGHERTAQAAETILQAGGNAFDAALAALCAACVAEPILASLGGGGFLLAHRAGGNTVLYDFFAQTPVRKRPFEELDFYPIVADFGSAQQEFHIGLGSIAVPGMVSGLFRIHKELCALPLTTIMEPALEMARTGVAVNAFQHYIATIIEPILRTSPSALRLCESQTTPGILAAEGERVAAPDLGSTLEALAIEGPRLFYEGEIGSKLVDDCKAGGGLLTYDDLSGYRVARREPLSFSYHGARIVTNAPPSIGGLLIRFTLSLLSEVVLRSHRFGQPAHVALLARAMELTQDYRLLHRESLPRSRDTGPTPADDSELEQFKILMRDRARFLRGTTQISVIDGDGNAASMTLSNGEGCGHVIEGTGIMPNNMLGEEDINPGGFHRWPENQRISSMMAPTLVFAPDGRTVATGSGGSNRIRSAVLQVLSNLIDFDMPLEEAVDRPRIHVENGLLNMEPGLDSRVYSDLTLHFARQKHWQQKNLFFGGAHSVMRGPDGRLSGSGDPRRGGATRLANGT